MEECVKVALFGEAAAAYADAIRKGTSVPLDILPVLGSTTAAADLADVAAAVTSRFDSSFPTMPELRLIQTIGAGFDRIDMAAVPATAAVCNCYGHEAAIAEYITMAVLVWCHDFLKATVAFRAGNWKYGAPLLGPQHDELGGKTVGLLGYGGIAKAAVRLLSPFGVRLTACSRRPPAVGGAIAQSYPLPALHSFLADLDFLVVTLPLADETRSIIGEHELQHLPARAVVVNVGRGPVIDEHALYHALKSHEIAGAVIDVWYNYPTAATPHAEPSRYPFSELNNVITTPHYAAWTRGMTARRAAMIAQNIDALATGKLFANIIRLPLTS
jgi:phosphoglycerate dehydrogenase-like enzyme